MHFCKALKMYLETIQSPAGMNTSGSNTKQIIFTWPDYQLTKTYFHVGGRTMLRYIPLNTLKVDVCMIFNAKIHHSWVYLSQNYKY